ncbi:Tim44/TimA family putative adaptor protein [Wolbachia endosymbiont of Litomosoides brasiliensis]|uniref:Tim44/TimA family putative adaptor protein n=1 Tax=Wolbachia endosymbiont of Litomosoides brasiliensis TaxID=1812117 RepID=UPI00158859A0|nr:Tim44/TimA family putative adaptor protein [Wolbachia endosymbiont of Litomosoides brasiliensis]NUY39401.1 Tim44/TimA family putative adaptor protein [Wolbachia endosymbiont of Litomosoides brasiliensis]
MIELVIYALLAAFVFSRLYNSFGRSTSLNLKKLTNVLDISQVREDVVENIEDYIDSNDKDPIKATYEQVLQKNKDFSISHFIEGSSLAFELIIKYFNQGNLSQLKPLLDKDLYNSFAGKIKQRKEVYESIIVSIVSQKILEIKLVKNVVFIVVYFLSEQINFVKNDKGDIISGSTSTINKVEDIWQFKKNVTSSNPNWLLTSINYKKADDDKMSGKYD